MNNEERELDEESVGLIYELLLREIRAAVQSGDMVRVRELIGGMPVEDLRAVMAGYAVVMHGDLGL